MLDDRPHVVVFLNAVGEKLMASFASVEEADAMGRHLMRSAKRIDSPFFSAKLVERQVRHIVARDAA